MSKDREEKEESAKETKKSNTKCTNQNWREKPTE